MPEFTKTQRIALVAGIGIAVIAMSLVAMVRGCGSGPTLVVSATAAGPAHEASASLTVHVKGAVAVEGLYRLPSGARVADAIATAGGAGEDADLQQLNLAAFLTDGQQVNVPRRFIPPPPTGPGTAEWPTPTGRGSPLRPGSAPPTATRLNINRATPEQIAGLPQIGPVLAERIVLDRQQNGPFRGLQDLARVQGLGPRRIEALRPYVSF